MFRSHFHQDFNCHHQRCYLRNILDERDVRRAPTIISYILEEQFSLSWECLPSSRTHGYTHLQSRATQTPSCCYKIPALPKSIVGNFCYCLFLAISHFLSVFLPVYLSVLVFVSAESLLGLQECVCWSRDEGWSVHRRVTGKIIADKRVLMKGAGPGPAFFGVECCQGLWGGSLWVLLPCWKVETAGRSISLQTECLCKEIKLCGMCWCWFSEMRQKGGSGMSCTL